MAWLSIEKTREPSGTDVSAPTNCHHTRHVWAPSAGFVISDARQDRIGTKEVELVEYRFQPDSFEVRHIRAPGQSDVDLDELFGRKTA
jgi:hypothetical protein